MPGSYEDFLHEGVAAAARDKHNVQAAAERDAELDRVARALREVIEGAPSDEPIKEAYAVLAVAAVKAMRAPYYPDEAPATREDKTGKFNWRYVVTEGPAMPPIDGEGLPLTHHVVGSLPGRGRIVHFTCREDAEEFADRENEQLAEWQALDEAPL